VRCPHQCYNPLVLRRESSTTVRNISTNTLVVGLYATVYMRLSRFIALIFGIVSLAFLMSASPVIVQKNAYVLPGNTKHIKTEAIVKNELKFVAITIDDTPDAVYTKKMLQVLLEHGARATFFVNGPRVKAFPETAKMMVAAGHEIANHTWNHPMLTKLSASKIEWELTSTTDIIEKICGVTPRFFRPPYGDFNSTVTRTALKLGLIPMLWSIDTRDWSRPGVTKICSTVSGQLDNGAVILMHGTNEQSPVALDSILTDLENKGFVTVTASEWFQLVGGSDGYDFSETGMSKELIDKLYDRDIVTTPEGEEIEILVPKMSDNGAKLSDLVIANSGSTISIYSNLSLVDGEELPHGLTIPNTTPLDMLKPSHNTVELHPEGKSFGFFLTDSIQKDYDELYYPRPKLVMVVDENDLQSLSTNELTQVYFDCRFDNFVVLSSQTESSSPEIQARLIELKALNPVILVNLTNFPMFTVDSGASLVRDYVDLLRQKRETIAVKVAGKTDNGTEALSVETQSEFARFRDITGKYTYDPAEDLRARWALPLDVEIGRYTGYNIIVVTLFSRTDALFTLTAKADDTHLEIMSFDESGKPEYEKIESGCKIEIGSTPEYIVYRWGEGANATHEASG
jgi:peptidoglycan/xylan/chitin deacetylase (PgdA/CDA1 family)